MTPRAEPGPEVQASLEGGGEGEYRRMNWPLKILLFLVLAYVLVLAAIFFAQTSLLFPARFAQASGPLPRTARPLTTETSDGERLQGLHVPPGQPGFGPKLLILGFGGNAWNAQHVAEFLHDLFPKADVVTFHYRGYAPSNGAPSAAALLEDAPLVHDVAVRETGAERVVAIGFSIGTGVAARLSSRRKLAGLILVTPFDSLGTVAARHYPWLPVRLLLRHRMEPRADLEAASTPVALITAGGDTLIPPERARALGQGLRSLVYDRTIPGVGHNEIYQHSAFRQAMHEALEKVQS